MGTTDFIAAIELGSSKLAGIAGQKRSDGSLQVLAYAKEDSTPFIRKGVIFNLDKMAQALTSIVNKLEDGLQSTIGKVYVGVGGQSMHTVLNTINRNLEEGTVISQELVDTIRDENISIPLADVDILEVVPQEYKIGSTYQIDPVGVVGSHIEGRFLNIVGRNYIKKNLERSFEQAKIEIAELMVSPLVCAEATLSEAEMRTGCALVDLGADTTVISIYKGSVLRYLTVLPLGSNSISQDIASLHLEEDEAEYLKKKYGDVLFKEESEEPTVVSLPNDERNFVLSELNNIIEARAEEIVANVWNLIEYSQFEDKLSSGIIITGGGANLKGIEELFRKISKTHKVRFARFIRHDVNAPETIDLEKDGMFNTLLGLLAAGNENCYAPPQPKAPEPKPEDLFKNDEELKRQEEEARAALRKKEEEERKRKEMERRNRTGVFRGIFKKIADGANDLFSDDDMK